MDVTDTKCKPALITVHCKRFLSSYEECGFPPLLLA